MWNMFIGQNGGGYGLTEIIAACIAVLGGITGKTVYDKRRYQKEGGIYMTLEEIDKKFVRQDVFTVVQDGIQRDLNAMKTNVQNVRNDMQAGFDRVFQKLDSIQENMQDYRKDGRD